MSFDHAYVTRILIGDFVPESVSEVLVMEAGDHQFDAKPSFRDYGVSLHAIEMQIDRDEYLLGNDHARWRASIKLREVIESTSIGNGYASLVLLRQRSDDRSVYGLVLVDPVLTGVTQVGGARFSEQTAVFTYTSSNEIE